LDVKVKVKEAGKLKYLLIKVIYRFILNKKAKSQMRIASVVIISTIVGWMLINFLGSQLNWAPKFAFLFDFCAIAAFVWALVVIFRVWLNRNRLEEN
jgi:hypothetical protein